MYIHYERQQQCKIVGHNCAYKNINYTNNHKASGSDVDAGSTTSDDRAAGVVIARSHTLAHTCRETPAHAFFNLLLSLSLRNLLLLLLERSWSCCCCRCCCFTACLSIVIYYVTHEVSAFVSCLFRCFACS